MILHITGMRSPECISKVKDILVMLSITFIEVNIGTIEIKGDIGISKLEELEFFLSQKSFQVIIDHRLQLIQDIKTLIITGVFKSEIPLKNYSDYLSKKLYHSYGYLENIFKEDTGKSINKYFNSIRILRAKILITN